MLSPEQRDDDTEDSCLIVSYFYHQRVKERCKSQTSLGRINAARLRLRMTG